MSNSSDEGLNEALSTQDVHIAEAFEADFAMQKAISESILTNKLSKAVQDMTLDKVKSDACSDCSYQYNRDMIDQSAAGSSNIESEKPKHTASIPPSNPHTKPVTNPATPNRKRLFGSPDDGSPSSNDANSRSSKRFKVSRS